MQYSIKRSHYRFLPLLCTAVTNKSLNTRRNIFQFLEQILHVWPLHILEVRRLSYPMPPEFWSICECCRRGLSRCRRRWRSDSWIRIGRRGPGLARLSGPSRTTSSWRATCCWAAWTAPWCSDPGTGTTPAWCPGSPRGRGSPPSPGATRVSTVWWAGVSDLWSF